MKNESLSMFKQLKLLGMADAYQAILSLPVNNHPDAHELIAQLLDAESQHRTDSRTKMYLRLSKLRYQATIQDIECSEQRNLSKGTLAKCSLLVPQDVESSSLISPAHKDIMLASMDIEHFTST